MEEVELVSLEPGQVLNVILDIKDEIQIEIVNGTGFAFGWKLPDRKPVKFRRQPFSIATMIGCEIRLSGQYTTFYVSILAPHVPELVKEFLDCLAQDFVPVTFVVGAPGTGKTSVCKEIANGVLNNFRKKCFYVSADPAQAPFSPQGCLGAIPVDFPVDNNGFPISDPICYYYGKEDWDEDRSPLYLGHMELLHERVAGRRKKEGECDGGVVVDFPAVRSKAKSAGLIECLYQALKIFHATHVIVVGNDELYRVLRAKYGSVSGMKIVNIPKLPAAYNLSKQAKTVLRGFDTGRYFYGDGNPFNATTHTIKKGEVDLFSLGDLRMADACLRPVELGTVDPRSAQVRAFVTALNHRVVALVQNVGREEIWKQNVIGFLHVQDIESDEMTVLKPNHEALPSRTCIVANISWTPPD